MEAHHGAAVTPCSAYSVPCPKSVLSHLKKPEGTGAQPLTPCHTTAGSRRDFDSLSVHVKAPISTQCRFGTKT